MKPRSQIVSAIAYLALTFGASGAALAVTSSYDRTELLLQGLSKNLVCSQVRPPTPATPLPGQQWEGECVFAGPDGTVYVGPSNFGRTQAAYDGAGNWYLTTREQFPCGQGTISDQLIFRLDQNYTVELVLRIRSQCGDATSSAATISPSEVVVPEFGFTVNAVTGTLLLAGGTEKRDNTGIVLEARDEIIEIQGLPIASSATGTGGTTPAGSNQVPTAMFSAAPVSAQDPLQVAFDGSASTDPDGVIVQYDWDYGDGGTGMAASVTHTYPSVGTYTVNLTVTDDKGATGTATRTYLIFSGLNGQPGLSTGPAASFTTSTSGGLAPLTVIFDASPSQSTDGAISDYHWNFGDGTTATGVTATHTFSAESIYRVNLTVTDDQGSIGTTFRGVAVLPTTAQLVPLTKLSGTTGGSPAKTAVYRGDLSGLGLASISSLIILDNSGGSGGSSGQFSGIDLDGVKLSTTHCADAACAAGLPGLDVFSEAGAFFFPGSQRPPEDPKLFGTDVTGTTFDETVATLGQFDANAGPSNPNKTGHLSMGDGGILSGNTTSPVSTAGLFIYVGEVGDAGELSSGSIYVSDSMIRVARDIRGVIDTARAAVDRGDSIIDLDGDGFREYTRIVDASGALQREEIDIDKDGSPNLVWDYSGPTKTFTLDRNGDGVPEKTRIVAADPANPGVTSTVVTTDSDGDNIPDYRYSYTVDPAVNAIQIRHEYDDDQDGSYSLWGNSTTTKIQNAIIWEPGSNCDTSQKQMIEQGYYDAVEKGLECLRQMDYGLYWQFDALVTVNDFVFKCGACGGGSGCVEQAHVEAYWEGFTRKLPIKIATFGSSMDGIIFHEMMHYVHGTHRRGDGKDDPGDPIYGCETACFGSGAEKNSQACAACLETGNTDSRCSDYPFESCIGKPVPAVCSFDGKVYPDKTQCAVSCPTLTSGLIDCKEIGPCS